MFNENEIISEVQLSDRLDFKFYLLNPQFELIQELVDLDSVTLNKKRNVPTELGFTLYADYEMALGTVLETMRPHYIIEAKSSFETIYFLILKSDIKISNRDNSIHFRVQEYPRQLAKDIVFQYEEVSKSLDEVVSELLSNSSWKLGYVDSVFKKTYRSFTFKQTTLLESIRQVAQRFNALIEWKSRTKTINFFLPSRLGVDKGLVINEDKYLLGLDYSIDAENVITRLQPYGKDNLSIARLTPTGAPFLEDYSWFMRPFEMDNNGNVLKSSYYMTDGLCKSILSYQEVLKKHEGRFDSLLKDREKQEGIMFDEWFILTDLEIKLKTATDELDVLNSTEAEDEKINEAIKKKENAEAKVKEQKEVIQGIEDNLKIIEGQIDKVREVVKKENNFTATELRELDNFTIMKVMQDTSVEEEKDLLEDSIKEFEKLKIPKLTANIRLANFLANKEYKLDWNKLDLGDIITITHEELQIIFYAQIESINYNLTNKDLTIRLQNENASSDHDSFTEQLYGSISASTTVNMDKYKWDMAEDAKDGVSQILNNAWDAAKQQIQGGVNQSVSISERGLIIRSSDSPNKMLVAQNGVLGLSQDGGNTWKTAITPEGVYAEELIGRIIMGNRLIIEDENGIIKLTGDKQTIYDNKENERVILGQYEKGKYGIKIKQGALEIEGGLTEGDLNPDLIEFLQYDDTEIKKTIRNQGDKITENDRKIRADLHLSAPLPTSLSLSEKGITAYSQGSTTSFARMDYRGMYIQGGALDIRTNGSSTSRGINFDSKGIRGYDNKGDKVFELDTDGNFTAKTGTFGGKLEAASGTFTGNLSAAGGTFSGNLSAAGGTFSGDLKAAGGTFSGTLQGVDGTFTGTLRGNSIIGASITGGEIDVKGSEGHFKVNKQGKILLKQGTEEYYSQLELTSDTMEFSVKKGTMEELFISPYYLDSTGELKISANNELTLASKREVTIEAIERLSLSTQNRIEITSSLDFRLEAGKAMTIRAGSDSRLRLRGYIDMQDQTVNFKNANVVGLSTGSDNARYLRGYVPDDFMKLESHKGSSMSFVSTGVWFELSTGSRKFIPFD